VSAEVAVAFYLSSKPFNFSGQCVFLLIVVTLFYDYFLFSRF